MLIVSIGPDGRLHTYSTFFDQTLYHNTLKKANNNFIFYNNSPKILDNIYKITTIPYYDVNFDQLYIFIIKNNNQILNLHQSIEENKLPIYNILNCDHKNFDIVKFCYRVDKHGKCDIILLEKHGYLLIPSSFTLRFRLCCDLFQQWNDKFFIKIFSENIPRSNIHFCDFYFGFAVLYVNDYDELCYVKINDTITFFNLNIPNVYDFYATSKNRIIYLSDFGIYISKTTISDFEELSTAKFECVLKHTSIKKLYFYEISGFIFISAIDTDHKIHMTYFLDINYKKPNYVNYDYFKNKWITINIGTYSNIHIKDIQIIPGSFIDNESEEIKKNYITFSLMADTYIVYSKIYHNGRVGFKNFFNDFFIGCSKTELPPGSTFSSFNQNNIKSANY